MSWHYLQGQEVESWEGDCLDGAPSALSRLIPTPEASCLPDRQTDALTASRSGMMCALLMDTHGEVASMSSAVAFPVRISAPLEPEKGSRELGPVCGWKWRALSERYDLDLSLWKTQTCLFPEVLQWSSVILPKWGMMRGGECWERITSELPIRDTDSGLWPTPVADGEGGTSLGYAVRNWPTPTVHGNHNRKGASKNSGIGLATAVKMWSTLTCHDRKGQSGAKRGRNAQGGECLTQQVGGTLSPMWVEWLMGWPVGWTDLEPLETDKFRQWLRSHGAC